MNFVEKHTKFLAVALCLAASGPILSTVHAYNVQPGWHKDGKTSYYVKDNHQKAKGLTEIEEDTYYFDQAGNTVSGWQNVDNQIYYFDNNGKAVTGKTEIQGTAYNFGTTGTLSQGWEDDNYYNEKGFKVTSNLVSDDDGTYYINETGTKVTDTWELVNDNWYYFDADGRSVSGEVNTGSGTYFTNADGIFRTGWFSDGYGTQYYQDNGALNTEPYLEIDGNLYAFDANGYLLTNTSRDGYVIDANGIATIPTAPVAPEVPEAPEQSDSVITAPDTVDPDEPIVDDTGSQTPSDPETPVVDETVTETPAVPETPVTDETPDLPPVQETVTPELPVDDAAGDYAGNEVQPEVDDTVSEPEISIPTVSEPVLDDFYYDEPIYPDTPDVIPDDITNPSGGNDTDSGYAPDQTPDQGGDDTIYDTPIDVPSTDNSKAQMIANAALAQVGVQQDCTMLVTNALAAVGINFHGWPADYASLGTWTSNPVPGDIIIYSGHVAIYIGNGQAVHGGFNGANTVVWSVNCSNALIGYIHVA